MDFLFIGLIVLLIMVLLFPTSEEVEITQEYQSKCELHVWESKETGFEDGSRYTVCAACGYLPGSGNYEL